MRSVSSHPLPLSVRRDETLRVSRLSHSQRLIETLRTLRRYAGFVRDLASMHAPVGKNRTAPSRLMGYV